MYIFQSGGIGGEEVNESLSLKIQKFTDPFQKSPTNFKSNEQFENLVTKNEIYIHL